MRSGKKQWISIISAGILAVGAVMPAAAAVPASKTAVQDGVIQAQASAEGGSAGTLAVRTQAVSITGFYHLSQTADSATIGWNAVEGARSYLYGWKLYDADGNQTSEQTELNFVSAPELTITGIPKGGMAVVYVRALDEARNTLADGTYAAFPVIPAVKETEYVWKDGHLKAGLKVNSIADKILMECYNRKGKKIETQTASKMSDGTANATFSKTKWGEWYRVKITPQVDLTSLGFGAIQGTAKTILCVPQPKITSKKNRDVKINSLAIRWKKVKNAKSYTIYACMSKKSPYTVDESKLKFKKIRTLGASKTKYVLTKIRGKKLNNKKYYCYFKVVTTAKIGGKKVKGTGLDFYYAHVY